MRVAVYLRVSTTEQAESLDTQERGVLAWCASHGHTVVATYRDVGVSGAEWARRKRERNTPLAVWRSAERCDRPSARSVLAGSAGFWRVGGGVRSRASARRTHPRRELRARSP